MDLKHWRARAWNRYRPHAAGLSLGAVVTLAGCTAQVYGENGSGTASAGSSAGAATGGTGGGNGGSGSTTAMGIDLHGEPKYLRFVRLTNAQWANSVQEVLRLTQPTGLDEGFQKPVSGTTDFSNNEVLLDVNQRAWSDYQAAAEKLAEQVTASDAVLAGVYPGNDAAGLIQTLGKRAYRRPLSVAELTSYTTLFDTGTAMAGSKSAFAKGAALVIRALLQSPHFLYRSELQAQGAALTGYEIAAKLSLWLRNSTPDDTLLDSAPNLNSADTVAAQAEAMLAEPASGEVMREFHRELLHFDRFTQISKLGVPSYDESLNAEYLESTQLFFDKIFDQGLGLRDILTSTRGFVGPGMAVLYGLPGSSGFVEQELGPQRTGYFSQLPYLTLNALNDEPDSIHRGVSLNLDVLCAPLGAPAIVLPPVPPLQPGQTNRERISTLTSGCGGACHNAMINPIGFAFEHFDGMGRYRDVENGDLPIDSSGSYAFNEGEKSFQDNAGLMQAMAESEQAHLCYAKKLASFALQRTIVVADLPWLTQLSRAGKSERASLKRLMLELVKTDAFRNRGGAP